MGQQRGHARKSSWEFCCQDFRGQLFGEPPNVVSIRDRQWLNHQLGQPGKTPAKLARAVGVNPSAVSHWRAGTRFISRKHVTKVESFFGAPMPPALAAIIGHAAECLPRISGRAATSVEVCVLLQFSSPQGLHIIRLSQERPDLLAADPLRPELAQEFQKFHKDTLRRAVLCQFSDKEIDELKPLIASPTAALTIWTSLGDAWSQIVSCLESTIDAAA
jgi:hypothetical protein